MKIQTNSTHIIVTSDYNSGFVATARNLGGKWDNPSWIFDIRNETAVREACLEHYGTDGVTSDVVDIRITIAETCYSLGGEKGPIELFGRTLARAFGRDSGAKLGDNVVVESGGFSSGGSMKNWRTTVQDNTIVILRDVSRSLVEKFDDDAIVVNILKSEKPPIKDVLIAERGKLIARIAEIDAQLED